MKFKVYKNIGMIVVLSVPWIRLIKDYIRFLNIAMGSIYELQTQLEIGLNLSFISKSNYDSNYKKIREIEIILRSLITKIHQSNSIT